MSRCFRQGIRPGSAKIEISIRGRMNYYGIASMKNLIDDLNGWLCRRIRMCIWKQWKLPRIKKRHPMSLEITEIDFTNKAANRLKGY